MVFLPHYHWYHCFQVKSPLISNVVYQQVLTSIKSLQGPHPRHNLFWQSISFDDIIRELLTKVIRSFSFFKGSMSDSFKNAFTAVSWERGQHGKHENKSIVIINHPREFMFEAVSLTKAVRLSMSSSLFSNDSCSYCWSSSAEHSPLCTASEKYSSTIWSQQHSVR